MHEICSQLLHTCQSTTELYFLSLFIWIYTADFGSTPLWYHESYPAREKFERLSWSTSSCPCQFGGILFSFSPRFCQLFHCGNVLSSVNSLACDLRYKICNANRKNMPIYIKLWKAIIRECLGMDWSWLWFAISSQLLTIDDQMLDQFFLTMLQSSKHACMNIKNVNTFQFYILTDFIC